MARNKRKPSVMGGISTAATALKLDFMNYTKQQWCINTYLLN